MTAPLEFVGLRVEHEGALAGFFATLVAVGDDRTFHPHPMTAEQATRITSYDGKDHYLAAVLDGSIRAYGMLRGWDEGYAIPSLGIAVAPDARGTGTGRAFMHYLHAVARQRGAERVRLKVYRTNTVAVELYRSLGYDFGDAAGGELVGLLTL